MRAHFRERNKGLGSEIVVEGKRFDKFLDSRAELALVAPGVGGGGEVGED